MGLLNRVKVFKKTICQNNVFQKYSTALDELQMIIPKKVKSPVSPSLKKVQLEKLKTATSLQISINQIAWCQADLTGNNCNILDWQCENCLQDFSSSSIVDTVKLGVKIAAAIPDSDAYVMEKSKLKTDAKSKNMVQIALRQEVLTSIILTQLGSRRSLEDSSNALNSIFLMRPFAPAAFFDLFHGNEYVSGGTIVEALINQDISYLKKIKSLSFDDECLETYDSLKSFQREDLNKCLLLALTFLEDAVLQQKKIKQILEL